MNKRLGPYLSDVGARSRAYTLASEGESGTIDNLVREAIVVSPNNEYGSFPPPSEAFLVADTKPLLEALRRAPWPKCFTRKNVQPDDAEFITAFALGCIQDYTAGPCLSKHTRKMAALTTLLSRWMQKTEPSFRFTNPV